MCGALPILNPMLWKLSNVPTKQGQQISPEYLEYGVSQ